MNKHLLLLLLLPLLSLALSAPNPSSSNTFFRASIRSQFVRSIAVISSLSYLLPSLSSSASASSSRSVIVFPTSAEMHELYSYQSSADFLRFLTDFSAEGDFSSVVQAMDVFAEVYPMYKLTPAKAALLANTVSLSQPLQVLEIGSFFGYSALHIARAMPPSCLLTCIEGSAENAGVAQRVLERAFGRYAEVLRRVNFIVGLSSAVLSSADLSISQSNSKPIFDFVFMDHDKDCYLPDLLTLEKRGLLNAAKCQLVADNVIFPGAPDFLHYVGIDEEGHSVAGNLRWTTQIVLLPFERRGFETQYKERMDGMAISRLTP